MRTWWKRLVLLLPVLVLLLGAGAVWKVRAGGPKKPDAIRQGDYGYAQALARFRIEQVMKQRHIPGVVVAVIDDQETVWLDAFGFADRDEEKPVTGETVFKLWSLAKPFTALEIMRLVEEGRLDLDAPLAEVVPGFSIQSRFADDEAITVRHLLTHRSGLPRNACRYGFGWETGPAALERLAGALEDCFLAYPTGQQFKYSNVGYDTLGYVIQAEREQPYPSYMRARLLLPTGMAHSAFYSTDLPAGSEVALGYEYWEGTYYPYEQADVGTIASGNLYSTGDDLAAFVKFLFRGGKAGSGQLLDPATLAAMYEDQYSRPADPQPMGLGWKLAQIAGTERLVWHDGGATEGTGSLVAMLPDRKLGVVLLGNATTFEGGVSLPIAADILAALLEAKTGQRVADPEPAEPVTVGQPVLETYAGSYVALGDVMEVTVDGRRLRGTIAGMHLDLVPIAENRFRVSHWLLTLGLADLLQLPMDLGELEITFLTGDRPASDRMIINFGGLYYETCARYPSLPADGTWQAAAGRYDLYSRTPSGSPAGDPLGETTVTVEDGRLVMAGVAGPILPLDDTTLILLGGPFHGEVIRRDLETGALTHQGLLYWPQDPAVAPGS